jgi:hypothetical protein
LLVRKKEESRPSIPNSTFLLSFVTTITDKPAEKHRDSYQGTPAGVPNKREHGSYQGMPSGMPNKHKKKTGFSRRRIAIRAATKT